jgi:hypothetical protein
MISPQINADERRGKLAAKQRERARIDISVADLFVFLNHYQWQTFSEGPQ